MASPCFNFKNFNNLINLHNIKNDNKVQLLLDCNFLTIFIKLLQLCDQGCASVT